MKFLVLSRREIEKFTTEQMHVVISVSDPDQEKVNLPESGFRLDTLHLSFHDLDRIPKTKPERRILGYMIISAKDAKNIVEFFCKYKDKVSLVICQCEAGICRSAGIASALAEIAGQDSQPFFRQYIPNMLVYRTILETAFDMDVLGGK